MLSYLVSSRSIQIHSDLLAFEIRNVCTDFAATARTHTLSLLFSLPPSVQTLTLARSFGTSKAPDRNPPGAYRDLESSRQNFRGPIGTSINSRPQEVHGMCSHLFSFRDLDMSSRFRVLLKLSSKFSLFFFKIRLKLPQGLEPFSLALTIILHTYTQAYSMCFLFIIA